MHIDGQSAVGSLVMHFGCISEGWPASSSWISASRPCGSCRRAASLDNIPPGTGICASVCQAAKKTATPRPARPRRR